MLFPAAIPEVPVASIDVAVAYYVGVLGFRLDWGDEAGGIAGISRGSCRLFLANAAFREGSNSVGKLAMWLNVQSKAEVDALHAEWLAAGAVLLSAPEDKPWLLREFLATDTDGNRMRVFYDFRHDV